VYLASARAHPPATLARQRERDFRFVVSWLQGLPERTSHLLLLCQAVVRRHRAGAIPPLTDADVAEAASALAATLETAARGIIYEHQAESLVAQRLVGELRTVLTSAARDAAPGFERDAAVALRRLERAARDAASALEPSREALLNLLDRLPEEMKSAEMESNTEPNAAGAAGATAAPVEARIIIP
jgi:hypothetical protein